MKITRERIFILPTRFGAVFLVGACVMLLVGATYQNNLVNLLAFFMFSLVFVAMVQTHNNLKDIHLQSVECSAAFAGGEVVVGTLVKNKGRSAHFNLETNLRFLTLRSRYDNRAPLLPSNSLRLKAAYSSPGRGEHALSEVKLSSIFPLGLFYAWCWFDINAKYLIYPEMKGERALPLQDIGEQDARGAYVTRGGDDFSGHRRFDAGDSPRHVDWKAFARGRPMMIKEFNEGAATSILLDWFLLEGLNTEERLSQLAKWVDEAHRRGLQFALRTPQQSFAINSGSLHAQRCLEHLAMFVDHTRLNQGSSVTVGAGPTESPHAPAVESKGGRYG